ncbi:MAG: hypothetical protein EBY44_03740 [Actinobacteria bacterium]|nr:hypothetical protein [Actinomycetota bacterium]
METGDLLPIRDRGIGSHLAEEKIGRLVDQRHVVNRSTNIRVQSPRCESTGFSHIVVNEL